MELHIITLCLIIMAYDKLKPLIRDVQNWIHRQQVERIHKEKINEIEV